MPLLLYDPSVSALDGGSRGFRWPGGGAATSPVACPSPSGRVYNSYRSLADGVA